MAELRLRAARNSAIGRLAGGFVTIKARLSRVRYSVAPIFLLAYAACTDRVVAPERPIPPSNRYDLTRTTAPKNLRDEFREIALRAPGFAGVWIDDAGQLRISSATPDLSAVVLNEVGMWLRTHGRSDLALRHPKIHRVKYDYASLVAYLETAKSKAASIRGVNTFGIDEKKGRVLVGVLDQGTGRKARDALLASALPADSWTVEVMPYAADVGLRTQQDSMVGGLGISGPIAGCTIGFVGYKEDGTGNPDYQLRMVTTASHCTSSQTAISGDQFGQPTLTRVIGTEVDEAVTYTDCGGYPFCRYADVAVIKMGKFVPIIAAGVAISTPTTYPADPPYSGVTAYTGSGVVNVLVGEPITKVGAYSGQTTGTVDQSCVDRQSTITPGVWTLCAMHATATADAGDSGSIVYIPSGGGAQWTPRAGGLLFQGGPSSIWFSRATDVDAALGYNYKFFW